MKAVTDRLEAQTESMRLMAASLNPQPQPAEAMA
jgi:hypothetical protein